MANAQGELKIRQFIPKEQASAVGETPPTKRARPPVPDEQRKRTRQACGTCRQRKEKCYGGVPCQRCVRDKTVCSLVADRGSSPDNVRQEPLTKVERTALLKRVLKNILGITSLPDSDLRAMDEALPRSNPNGAKSADKERPEADDNTESSLLTFSRQLQQKLGDSKNQDDEVGAEPMHPAHSNPGSGDHLVNFARAAMPSRGAAEALIEVCMSYGPVNSFYVSLQWIQRALESCYDSHSCLTNDDLPDIVTLSMIIAHGSQFLKIAPHMPALTPERLGCSMEDLRNGLFERASSLISELVKRPTFESVRACLLIATFLFPIDLPRMAYTYLGLALHMAIRIGMHKKAFYAGTFHTSIPMREEQIRVWWTLYTFYQRARIFHGHPRTLTHSEVDVDRPRPTPELEPSDGVSNFRNSIVLIDVTLIAEDVAGEIALLRKARRGVHIANLLACRRKLEGLLSELPTLTSSEQLEGSSRRLRLDVHACLHYWHIRLFLGRPFLLAQSASDSTDESESTKSAFSITSGRKLLARDSVDAAIRIVQLCQIIHDRIGLTRASYATEFTCCRAAMLVLIAKSITDKNDEVYSALEQGLILIQQISIGQSQASSETRVIVALQRAITRLHQGENTTEPSSSQHQTSNISYDGFFHQWERLWQQSSEFPLSASSSGAVDDMPVNIPSHHPAADDAFPALEDFPDLGSFSLDYDASDWWDTIFSSQLNEFTIIPEMDNN